MAEQKFYVVGGEYADTTFEHLANGGDPDIHGPFLERDAKDFWRSITGKTVDNAMIRYVLKAEEEINGPIYWVVGGEYADTTFKTPASGTAIEAYGPFEKGEALDVWRSITGKTVDYALVRYDIRERWGDR
ncbi:MAG: DUF4170 domain-containing protein [Rhodospirillaceae bacterium]|jgi:hypothetical protein|nr:DUF4170 domain-containing protein [Rhodospirillaceae bacterium]MBT5239222.1 DUF4170 domain-containing protein [Rhodospirillaceae bacterium]MBT5566831.1 DUF4170 domain-containing protein [Rhodospirillaceae bacterium]MBT6089456.1 DUF4170 domain-containing protein [Rhodospirillaceae bacterium]MBT6962006.1 DUF4170 domain-containing protein [Rhodospirillaceae bacterium]